MLHPSNSAAQGEVQKDVLMALEVQLGVKLDGCPSIDQRLSLDGFADREVPICVEVWAHQGPARGSQPSKVMEDVCKLLLVERLLGRNCRKIIAACDMQAISFLRNRSWMARVAREFGIEPIVVEVSEQRRAVLRERQMEQGRRFK